MSTAEPITREQWLAERRKGIGASEAAAALGLSHYKSPYALWAEKTGLIQPDDLSDNIAVRLGLVLEQGVGEVFGDLTGRYIAPWPQHELARHPSLDYMICTPDATQRRVEADTDGVLQIKTSNMRMISEWQPEPEGVLRIARSAPVEYQIQLAHELAVTGLQWGTLVCMFDKRILAYIDMDRNERFISLLVTKLGDFMDMVRTNRPPEIDWTESTRKAIAKAHPDDNGETIVLPAEAVAWERNLTRLKAHIKILERFEAEYENRIKAAIGDNTFGVVPDGGVYSWKTQDRREVVQKACTFRVLRHKAGDESTPDESRSDHDAIEVVTRSKRLTNAEIRNRLLAEHDRCRWCNKTLTKRTATLEHLVPTAQGGEHNWNNWALACKECNQKRADTGLHPNHVLEV